MTLSREALRLMTPEQLRALSRKKQAIPGLPRDGRDLPASFAQQRLWFLSQMDASSDAYHIARGVELTGALDRAALQGALDALVARHESLRTTFEAVEGVPYQRIGAPTAFALIEHDLSALDDDTQRIELTSLQTQASTAPFDLERDPMVRGRLIRLAADRHVLLLTMHHIASDGWSMGVLSRELEALYSARVRSEADALPALPVQYADYAVWQRERLSGERLARESAFWRETLQGAPSLLELPTDRKRPPEQDYRGALLEVSLDAPLTAQLKALSLRHGGTLYMTLMAAWSVVLSRLSGQTDVVIGTPVANRGRSEVEGLIGFFANTLPVRVDLEDGPTVSRLIDQVKQRVLLAQEHQELPFEQVVEVVNPTRSLAYAPIFQTMFAWQDGDADTLRLEGLDARRMRLPHATSTFDLTLSLMETADGGIAGLAEYATTLFDASTIERYVGYLQQVLRGMVADEHTPVSRLPLLDDATYRALTQPTVVDAALDRDAPLHAGFERHAAATPDAVAVRFEGTSLTYRELNDRANRLAHWLRGRGVGPEALVAVCMSRSPRVLEAMLATLKAGGAYLPLDPQAPPERLRDVLADARPRVVLVDAEARRTLAGIDAADVFDIEADAAQWQDQPAQDPTPEQTGLRPEHLAYVIYTSGSTGTPKGVMIEHRQIAAVRAAWAQIDGLRPGQVHLQMANIAFDVFTADWVRALSFGGTLAMCSQAQWSDSAALYAFMQAEKVTFADFVPGVVNTLIEHLETTGGDLTFMETVLCGSDLWTWESATRLRRLCGENVKIENAYGLTEASVDSTRYAVGPQTTGEGTLPIGRAIPNVSVYVLDGERQPSPEGVIGELYVGGAGLARGYLNRPELTAERFVEHPFAAGERLYRTGDLARWRDGDLDYLGRNDFQVKVRGYRIELGEIEAKLAAQPGVKTAVVVAREDRPGEAARLVAYYECEPGGEGEGDGGTTAEALRAGLGAVLPAYMVPAAYVEMREWPFTRNGKLDRKALPAPERSVDETRYAAPEGAVETGLAAIWSDLLGVARVGRDDNFFELGGHSLLAVRLISAARQQLGLEIGLTGLFLSPTVASLAARLKTNENEHEHENGSERMQSTMSQEALSQMTPAQLRALRRRRSQSIAVVPRDGRDLPASFAQQRLWFLSQMDTSSDAYHIAQGVELVGALDRAALQGALDALVARHESLRTTFEAVEGVPFQRIGAPTAFVLIEHDLASLDAAAQAAALLSLQTQESTTPFDLQCGPLLRGRLIRLAPDRHALLLTMHHIVSDGWSMGVLSQELETLYSARVRGEADALPALPVQYADYAAWQRERLSGERLARESAFWRETLQGAPSLLELPTDRKRPPEQDYRGALLELSLDAPLTQALKALSLRHGGTLYMTLMAAWSVVLSRLSGQTDVVIGTPVANRGRSEVEGLIGFFVNALPVRLDLEDGPTASSLIEQVKQRVLLAQEHQELPFEQVVEVVNPTRSLAYAPIFQTMFAWQNNAPADLRFAGLTAARLDMPHATSAFDLTLSLMETAGGGIEGVVEYATTLFDTATVQRYADYLQQVLRGMVADVQQPVSRLPLLDEATYRALTQPTVVDATLDLTASLHAGFERHAAATPDAVAVRFEGTSLTYRELNARANRLAHWLRDRGVGPEALVAVCMSRSPRVLEAMLATLKAGGAYLPLDPQAPPERLRDVLADARPRVVLVDAEARRTLAGIDAADVFDIEADAAQWQDQPAQDPTPEQTGLLPEHLAYVIYTSGSTGTPKGVMIEHRQIAAVRAAWAQTDGLRPGQVHLQMANIAFDVFTADWVRALSFGGTLAMCSQAQWSDSAALYAFMQAEKVTFADFVPGVVNTLIEHLETTGGDLTFMETVLCGSDLWTWESAQRLRRLCGEGVKIENAYGLTEASVDSTRYAVGPQATGEGTLPIGRAIPNVSVYVLDGERQPSPEGVIGELYVGGAGLARGYLNRPELTAERFVEHPFAAGERLYRTGDLARWRDGDLDYLGRNDFQVKVRGYRIELGEIEAKLLAQPGVKTAVVVAREDRPGEPARLVAYYECEPENGTMAEALRAGLGAVLPAYMVPAAYVEMREWPFTRNGKLDRKALPAPERSVDETRYAAPEGAVETGLAAIWSELLGVARVGRDDNFFELGGHSLLAVRLISAARQQLGLEIGLTGLFLSPTVASLAARLKADQSEEDDESLQGEAAEMVPEGVPSMVSKEVLSQMTPAQFRALRRRGQSIPTVPRDGHDLPASFSQQRLWFLSQLGASSDAYHIAQGVELVGALDRAALQGALDALVARHESLRTTFEAVEGVPFQRIGAPTAFVLVEHDLSGLDAALAQIRLAALQTQESSTPFDLARGPLLRGRLIRLAADRHVLLLTMHHIVSDGWSMGVLSQELEAMYSARVRGEADALPALPVQYADYAAWQRERLSGERLARESAFWRETLQGAPSLLELPTDRKRPPEQDYRGALLEVTLDAPLTAQLKALSLRHGGTLYMTLMAAWSVVLSRLSGQTDVVIGTPVANRGRSEIAGLIGFFVNALPVRLDLENGTTASSLIDQVKQRVLLAQEHQELPFEQVVELVNPTRSLAYAPIFQTMFAWQNNESGDLRFAGLTAKHLDMPHAVAKFDLTLSLMETPNGGIEGVVEYATTLFDTATVQRYADYLQQVLRGMAADEHTPVNRLPLLGDDEYRQVTEGWNATAENFGPWQPVHASVEAYAATSPTAEAVTCGEQSLDYATLNSGANRLAHWLRAQGVGAETLVAICVQRSVWAIEAVLGIMKSGGAYVPVDPTYPQDRIAEMLGDARPALVLTDAASRKSLDEALARIEGEAPQVFEIDSDRAQWSEALSVDLPLSETGLTAEHPAYVIYTSGSTGKPKGVVSRHGGPTALMHALREPLGLSSQTRVLQCSSFSFDAFVLEWVMAFGAGGSLHLGAPGELLLGDALDALVARQRITHGFITPGVLSSLPDTAQLTSLQTLMCGGEAVPPALLRRWNRGRRFINGYGPTETTAISITYLCPPGLETADTVPLGRPVANEQVYILDHDLQPVPTGVIGELYIGGAGVALGYLRRPEITAERFIDSPFVQGARLYRTGDLGCWRSDGLIEYRGRNDFQVKIRGYRIELGEIEAKLAALPGVKDAVVLARQDAPDQPARLVAYYECDVEGGATADALRAQLQAQLQDYMVPTAYVEMHHWPLTGNGKLDRKALPAPEGDALAGRVEYEAPATPVEEIIAGIWAQMLGVERVGRHDNFFALGGHSLLGVRLITRVRKQLGLEIAPNALFSAPTLAAFAAQARIAEQDTIPHADRRNVLASFAQQRMWFLAQMDASSDAYHIAEGVELVGALDRAALQGALDALVARHESLRTTFEAVDGVPYQRIGAPNAFVLIEHDLASLEASAQAAALLSLQEQETGAPFDLERGPLLRGRLIRLAPDRHALLLTMHHIVSDGWSMGVLSRELEAMYSARVRGEADALPALPVQYADYAAWQRDRLSGERLAQESDYWRALLQGAPSLLELPTDRKRPAQQDYRGAMLEVNLDAPLAARLKALSLRHGGTLYMTLMAAWSVVLSRLSGQSDVVIGTPVANRNRSEVEGLIGFFVNTLAVRVDLEAGTTVSALIDQVKQRVLSAQEHQELPFEQVVEVVNPTRSLAYAPIFQTMFAWQSNESGDLRFEGLSGRRLPVPHAVAKFDLILSMMETSGGSVDGAIEYATTLFDTATVQRYAGYLQQVLRGMAADEETPVNRLPLLGEDEYRQVTAGWNATAEDFGPWQPVHASVEAYAATSPTAEAVTCGEQSLDYATLNSGANRLAHWLRGQGVGAETLVAICVQRSVWAIEAVLGIMKSGGAYVPVDPTYPQDRIAEMLGDARPMLVLTDAASRRSLDEALARIEGEAPPVFEIDSDRAQWSDASSANLSLEETGLTPEHLAYVIYTSGSTGKPKGVMSRHGGPTALMHAMREPFTLSPQSRVVQCSSFSFDAFVLEWVMAFGAGGSLHLGVPGELLLGETLDALVARQRITHAFITPGVLSSLPDTVQLASLQTILCGGEAVPPALLRRWNRERRFFNVYGPTETTAISITYLCPPGQEAADTIPLGQPLANEQVYILDHDLQPVPTGVIGELHIGGAGVALGYLHRPEITAERFIDSPFIAGDRLYRTGDLGCWRSDGLIEYRGRNDFQVKIRGYRIELGEIEAKLAALPGVKDAVVLARQDAPDQPARLVAYYECDVEGGATADALRAQLQAQLQDYMVPTAYMEMRHWPLTSNGKLDRKALPVPEAATGLSGKPYVAPRTPIEEVLAIIWIELLGVERVGVHDNFFDLGGHSLMAMRLIAAVRDTLGIALPLKAFFESPTIEHMGRILLPDEVDDAAPGTTLH